MPKPSQSLSASNHTGDQDPSAMDATESPGLSDPPETDRNEEPTEDQDDQDTSPAQQDQDLGEEEGAGDSEPIDQAEILATVEAILFATDTAISESKIAQVGELPGRRVVKQAILQLNQRYEEMGCAFRIDRIAGGFQMLTREEYHDVLARLLKVKSDSRLSQAAMETLAVVAYRQPIIRADVEAIRGVACGDMIRKLMEKGLVKIVGRAEVLGRPMLYGTTRRFLEVFGLNSLEDLPGVEELRGGAQEESPQASQDESAEQTDESNPSQDTAPQADAQEPDEQTEPAAEKAPDDPDDAVEGDYAPEGTQPADTGQEEEQDPQASS